jgi:hypothetical protein
VIERVTFFNEESGFCVLRMKAPGHREEVTVIGSLPSVSAGEWLSGEGWWVRDKEHGLQFKASTIRTVPPKSQGSEFPAVVIPLAMQHFMLLQRNLIYTGLRGASGCWCSSDRRKLWALRFATTGHSGGIPDSSRV